MELEVKKYELLEKNDAYIGTVTTDFAYVHIFRAYKPIKEEGAKWGIEVTGQVISTEIFDFLNMIYEQFHKTIINSNVSPVSYLDYEKIEELYEKVKEIKKKLK